MAVPRFRAMGWNRGGSSGRNSVAVPRAETTKPETQARVPVRGTVFGVPFRSSCLPDGAGGFPLVISGATRTAAAMRRGGGGSHRGRPRPVLPSRTITRRPTRGDVAIPQVEGALPAILVLPSERVRQVDRYREETVDPSPAHPRGAPGGRTWTRPPELNFAGIPTCRSPGNDAGLEPGGPHE
jgi:hypothetical protein